FDLVVGPSERPHEDGADHHDDGQRLREQPYPVGLAGPGLGGEPGDVDVAHDASAPASCSSRSWASTSVTVVMSIMPTYCPRVPVTTAWPPSARIASSASCRVDCVLTVSPTGLPRPASDVA